MSKIPVSALTIVVRPVVCWLEQKTHSLEEEFEDCLLPFVRGLAGHLQTDPFGLDKPGHVYIGYLRSPDDLLATLHIWACLQTAGDKSKEPDVVFELALDRAEVLTPGKPEQAKHEQVLPVQVRPEEVFFIPGLRYLTHWDRVENVKDALWMQKQRVSKPPKPFKSPLESINLSPKTPSMVRREGTHEHAIMTKVAAAILNLEGSCADIALAWEALNFDDNFNKAAEKHDRELVRIPTIVRLITTAYICSAANSKSSPTVNMLKAAQRWYVWASRRTMTLHPKDLQWRSMGPMQRKGSRR